MWFVVWFDAVVAAVSIIASENETEINIEMELKEIYNGLIETNQNKLVEAN